MGTFHYPVGVGDPQATRFETVDALVDTGATYTLLPASLLSRLGVTPHDRVLFMLADGRRVERDVGRTWVRIDGKSEITLVIFGDEEAEPLVGAYTLEGLRLGVDPVNRRFVPISAYLMASPRRPSGPTDARLGP